MKKLKDNNIPCESVRFIEELLSDEQALINNNIIKVKHHTGDNIITTGPVLDFNYKTKKKSAPKLGQHTIEILTALGYKKDIIKDYIKNQIII